MNCFLDAIALHFASNNESKFDPAHDVFMFLIHCRVTKAQVSLRKLTRLTLRFSHTQSMDIDEDSDQISVGCTSMAFGSGFVDMLTNRNIMYCSSYIQYSWTKRNKSIHDFD